jgi:CBS domain containing-hemolysin-like protein
MVPKNIALAGPENTAVLLAPPLRAIATFLGPVVRGLNSVSNAVVRLSGREPRDEVASAFTRDEVAALVAESTSEGLLEPQEHELINSALDFDTGTIDNLLLPDADVVSLPTGVTAADVEQACTRTGFSRFPIRDEDGRYSGYLHIRDVIAIAPERRNEPVPASRIRPLPVVEAGTHLRVALDRMRRRGAHLAQIATPARPAPPIPDGTDPAALLTTLVIPPAEPGPGARLGLVTLEDVIEELIGEIRDATRRPRTPAAARPSRRIAGPADVTRRDRRQA